MPARTTDDQVRRDSDNNESETDEHNACKKAYVRCRSVYNNRSCKNNNQTQDDLNLPEPITSHYRVIRTQKEEVVGLADWKYVFWNCQRAATKQDDECSEGSPSIIGHRITTSRMPLI
jgi:hypothetical protein